MSEQELIKQFPDIKWRTPVPTRLLGDNHQRLACRLCICMKGLKGADVPELPATQEDFSKHMAFTHNLIAVFENE